MLLRDLISNGDFDLNCNYAVYDGIWNDNGNLLWSTRENRQENVLHNLLDRKIKYITTSDDFLIIEIL